MKRFAILLLAILLFTSLTPNSAIALAPPFRLDFTYYVHSNFEDGFLMNTDYLESKGCLPSRYGTGCVPLIIETREEYDLAIPWGPTVLNMDSSYFDENFVVLIYAEAPEFFHRYEVNDVYCFGSDIVYIDYTCIQPTDESFEGIQRDVIEIHVSREHFGDTVPENIVLNPRITLGDTIARKYQVFDISSVLVDIDPKYYYGVHAQPSPIESVSRLAELRTRYPDASLDEYAEALPENFFEDNFLLYFLAVSPTQTVKYEIGAISADDVNNLWINATYDRSNAMDMAVQCSLIVISLARPEEEYSNYFVSMTECNRKGDVDGNGFIEVYDYIYAKRAYFGTYSPNAYEKSRADVNRDGVVDQYDYILIKRIYFGTYTAD